MGSGKSLRLLATAYNFQEHYIPFLLLKSKIDTRDGENTIYSRGLGKRDCVMIDPEDSILKMVLSVNNTLMTTGEKKIKWILVDEAQFLTPTQVDELATLSDLYDINVLCYGLRTDFQTHLFPGSKRLMEIADSMEEIKSSCYCGHKTIFNARIDKNGDVVTEGNQVEVGGDDRYISMCRKCYNEKIGNILYGKRDKNGTF